MVFSFAGRRVSVTCNSSVIDLTFPGHVWVDEKLGVHNGQPEMELLTILYLEFFANTSETVWAIGKKFVTP